jgi:hypothetical protein
MPNPPDGLSLERQIRRHPDMAFPEVERAQRRDRQGRPPTLAEKVEQPDPKRRSAPA